MNRFKKYSVYYDLLYKDKNYKAEARYIHQIILEQYPTAKKILDLGCGTGKHDFELSRLGYSVTGVDLSEDMIGIANLSGAENQEIRFMQGDIRNLRLENKFDIVVSLFHVLSYQTTDKDFKAAFDTAGYHLKKEGIFIFDIWNSSAVHKEKPEVRIKRLSDENVRITRLAEPTIHDNNIVDVNYEIFIEDLKDQSFSKITETHSVRHFSDSEIASFAKDAGFSVIRSEEFLTRLSPSSKTWGVCYILKKQ